MRPRNRLLTILILASCLVSRANGVESAVQWQPTLENAKRVAGQTNRLVLIHFMAQGCAPCRAMDQHVFSRQDVAETLSRQYVPVKIDLDQWPSTSKQYGVSAAPTDVVVTSQGLMIGKMVGAAVAEVYIERLEKTAAYYQQQTGQQLAQSRIRAISPVRPVGPDTQQPPIYSNPINQIGNSYPPLPSQNGSITGFEGSSNPMPGPDVAPYVNPSPPTQNNWKPTTDPPTQPNPPVIPNIATELNTNEPIPPNAVGRTELGFLLPSNSPPLALDGYCAVTLKKQKDYWVRGNNRWGVEHEGRTYLFAGPEEAELFYQNPEHYAPVLSGNDVVVMVEQQRDVPGIRKHGGWFKGRLYLFSSQATFAKFEKNPQFYQEGSKQLRIETAARQQQQPFPAKYPNY